MGSAFFMAQHIYFHIAAASLIKRWVAPSVGAAQDETRAKRHCQEVYGPGVWGHCLHVAREMCLRREKMAAYTGNDSLDIHPGRFTFGRRPSVFWANVMLFFFFSPSCEPILSGLQSRTAGEVSIFGLLQFAGDNSCSCCQECRLFLNAYNV